MKGDMVRSLWRMQMWLHQREHQHFKQHDAPPTNKQTATIEKMNSWPSPEVAVAGGIMFLGLSIRPSYSSEHDISKVARGHCDLTKHILSRYWSR